MLILQRKTGTGALVLGNWDLGYEHQKIISSDLAAGDRFGYVVDVSADGNTMVAGAYYDQDLGIYTGAAYVFVKVGENWTQQQKLASNDLAQGDFFGEDVRISADGNHIIVGAPREDDGGSAAGAAYVFSREGSVWSQTGKVLASDPQISDYFGTAVAINGDGTTIAVGAPQEDTGGGATGSAYIYFKDGETWTHQAKVQGSNVSASTLFGTSISLSSDGNTAVISAHNEDIVGTNEGAVYVFGRTGSTWSETQRIAVNGADYDEFGRSVSINGAGNIMVVGSLGEDGDTGAAYVYVKSGATWSQEQRIVADDRFGNDNFGISVDINDLGDAIIVGSVGSDDPAPGAGAAYMFTKIGATWSIRKKFIASDAQANDNFGNSVAIGGYGNVALVGAYGEDAGGTDAGAAYIFLAG